MGWFSWVPWFGGNKPSEPKPPARQDRQKCWEARDAYFACLGAAGIVKPGDEGKACATQLKAYEGACAKSWIEYFNQRRVLGEQQKESLAMANTQAEEARRKAR